MTDKEKLEAFLKGDKSIDLRWADLSRAFLFKADLSGANLFRADLSGAFLSEANLSKAKLFQADLSWADLIGANLIGAKHIETAIFTGANIQGIILDPGVTIKTD